MLSPSWQGWGKFYLGRPVSWVHQGCQSKVQTSYLRDTVPCRLISIQVAMASRSCCLLGGVPQLTIVGFCSYVEDNFSDVFSACRPPSPKPSNAIQSEHVSLLENLGIQITSLTTCHPLTSCYTQNKIQIPCHGLQAQHGQHMPPFQLQSPPLSLQPLSSCHDNLPSILLEKVIKKM